MGSSSDTRNPKPLFSIIVPVYNTEKYVANCLDSALSQEFDDYEIVVVDDGSTDASSSICREYADKFTQVKLFSQENRGLLFSRRTGIARACGEYYIFLDSDDMLRDGALQVIAHAVSATNADVVLFGHDRNWSALSKRAGKESLSIRELDKRSALKALCSTYKLNSMWGKACKAEVVDNGVDYEGYRGVSMGEDVLQVADIFERANRFVKIDEKLYYYRKNSGSLTAKFDVRSLDAIERVYLALQEHAFKWEMQWDIAGLYDSSRGVSLWQACSVLQSAAAALSFNDFVSQCERFFSGDYFARLKTDLRARSRCRRDYVIAADLLTSKWRRLGYLYLKFRRFAVLCLSKVQSAFGWL